MTRDEAIRLAAEAVQRYQLQFQAELSNLRVPGDYDLDPWATALLIGQRIASADPAKVPDMRLWPLERWIRELGPLLMATQPPQPPIAVQFPDPPPPQERSFAMIPAPPALLPPVLRESWIQARTRAGEYARGLGNDVDRDTGEILAELWDGEDIAEEIDAESRARTRRVITEETAGTIELGQSPKKLASRLGNATGRWGRDWERVARTELRGATSEGAVIEAVRTWGDRARVARTPEHDACVHCQRLFLDPDRKPRIFTVEDLLANGTNVGKRANNWLPTLWPAHPKCLLPGTLITTRRGNVPVEHVTVFDDVLTHKGRYRRVLSTWASLYVGAARTLQGDGFSLTVTPNHGVQTPNGWVAAEFLRAGDDVIRECADAISGELPRDANDLPAGIYESRLFASVRTGLAWCGVPVTTINFDGETYIGHGDVYQEEIAGNQAKDRGTTCGNDGCVHCAFVVRPGNTSLSLDAGTPLLVRQTHAAGCVVCRGSQCCALGWFEERHTDSLSAATAALAPSGFSDPVDDGSAIDVVAIRYLFYREQCIEVQNAGDFRRDWAAGRTNVICAQLGLNARNVEGWRLISGGALSSADNAPTLAQCSDRYAVHLQPTRDCFSGDIEPLRNRLARVSAAVHASDHVDGDANHSLGSPSRIVNATDSPHAGVVYNLSVEDDQSYAADGVIVHNCRCDTQAVPPGFGFDETWDLVPD